MTITSKDIFNQRFSVARKGYHVDEVDQCLERIAGEVDKLNAVMAEKNTELTAKDAEIENLKRLITSLNAKIFQYEGELENIRLQQQAEEDSSAEDEKDALIAELQRALAEKDDNKKIIADTLIAAKRSAREILDTANAEAAEITDRANAECQKIKGTIAELTALYKKICVDYSDTLKRLVTETNEKIDYIETEIIAKVGEKDQTEDTEPAEDVEPDPEDLGETDL